MTSSPEPSPTVSVIVPARNAAPHLAEAVQAALDQKDVAEVIVATADAESRRAADAIDDDRVVVVDNPKGSTPAGLNRALEEARGDVIVRCDAHARLSPGYVERALATLQTTSAVNVGGRQVPVGETLFERAVALAMVSPLGAGDARYRIGGEPGPVDTVYLGVFPRAALEAAGGFDENLERNQDYELNWRLRRGGGVVWFDPALGVEYRPRGSVVGLWRQYFDYGYWKRVVLARHPKSLRWRQLAAPALVVGLVGSALAAPTGWRGAAILPGTYLAATITAGLIDGARWRDPAALVEPPALWTMHLAWGSGFIAGLLSGRRRGRPRTAS